MLTNGEDQTDSQKTNTPGMFTYQDDSTSFSSSGEEVDTETEESRWKGDKLRYNRPIFTGGEGKVTQAPEEGRIKCKVILEYSSNEVSESQLDQLISPEYPTVQDVAKIKKMKKSVKLTIPCHPTVEGLTESFITWYKDHGMTTSLRKGLEANRWTEQMHEFKQAYNRKYKISQDYAIRDPNEKLSDEDKLEEGVLADLVGPRRRDTRKTVTGTTARTSGSKGGGSRRPAPQRGKDSEKGTDGSASERTTKKKKAKKTSPPDTPREGKKKVVKCKKGQSNEPEPVTSEPPPEKKQKGERKKKKRRKAETNTAGPIPKKKKAKETPSTAPGSAPDVELLPVLEVPPGAAPVAVEQRPSMDDQLGAHLLGTDPSGHSGQAKPDRAQFNGAPGPRHGRFLSQTQKIYSPGWSMTGVGRHSCSEVAQAVLDTSSHG